MNDAEIPQTAVCGLFKSFLRNNVSETLADRIELLWCRKDVYHHTTAEAVNSNLDKGVLLNIANSQVGKGGLPPLKSHFDSTLSQFVT